MSDKEQTGELDPAMEAAARRIARAFATTCAYYRKTALMTSGVAFVTLIAGAMFEGIQVRGCLMVIGIAFFIMAYRTVRLTRSYLDPAHSPVLLALALEPDTVTLSFESDHKGGPAVIAKVARGTSLALRLEGPDFEAEARELMGAFDKLASSKAFRVAEP